MAWNLDWLLGKRDWCVVDDGCGYRSDRVYPIPESRIDSGDVVIVRGLRRKAARRKARELASYYDHPAIGRPHDQ